jgi:hypothetical protein
MLLLCEAWFSTGYAKALVKSAYEGAVQQDCEKLLSLAAAADELPSIFRLSI